MFLLKLLEVLLGLELWRRKLLLARFLEMLLLLLMRKLSHLGLWGIKHLLLWIHEIAYLRLVLMLLSSKLLMIILGCNWHLQLILVSILEARIQTNWLLLIKFTALLWFVHKRRLSFNLLSSKCWKDLWIWREWNLLIIFLIVIASFISFLINFFLYHHLRQHSLMLVDFTLFIFALTEIILCERSHS